MPELLLKTITQQSFTLDVEEKATIGEVKQKIEDAKGKDAFPVGGQKLIYNGKVLDDSLVVSELNIAPHKFIVVMVTKKPTPPKDASSSSTTPPVDAEQQKTKQEPSPATLESKAEKKDSTEPAVAEAKTEVPEEHVQTVATIEAMGYPREEVIRALKAAFFNADRAVEYLCTGIPEGLNLQGGTAQAAGADEGEEGDEAGDDPVDLAFLAQSPQFQQLRDLIRAQPDALPQIVQQIAQSNPQLMSAIANHQEEFLQMLNAPQAGAEGAAAGGGAAGGAAVGAQPAAQRSISIPVTPQDREAIDRLSSMGFPQPLVIEAYFACDKNEDLAVNYILARMEELHEEHGGQGGGQ